MRFALHTPSTLFAKRGYIYLFSRKFHAVRAAKLFYEPTVARRIFTDTMVYVYRKQR